jgi:hypothetical protein
MDASVAERATYYEQEGPTAAWKEITGKAVWGTRFEPAGSGSKTEPVLVVDVQVPERGLALEMSVRRDASANAAMSHLIEFQFTGSAEFPVEGISGVMGISMKNAEDKNSNSLAGLSVRVAPGVFLFGLSPDKAEARRNVELLRTLSRLDIPVAFADGRTGIIAVEKGASGERVIADVLGKWEQ